MTAPASFNTPNRIIAYAMKDAGLLQDGDDPTSEQYAEFGNRLNDVINMLQTQPGLKLWTYKDLSIPMVQGTNTYTIGVGGSVDMNKPLRVLQGYWHDTTTSTSPVDIPITMLSWQEWLTLSNKTTQGRPTQFFVDKQQTLLSIGVWLTPDASSAANGTAHLLIQNQLTNFTEITDTLNFTPESMLALRWTLADEICTGQPEVTMQRCAMRAAQFQATLNDWDVEDASTKFEPDATRGYGRSRFR